jgi:hypothetical protein
MAMGFIRLYIAVLHDLHGPHSMLRSRSILGALIVVRKSLTTVICAEIAPVCSLPCVAEKAWAEILGNLMAINAWKIGRH